jgi:hypothetical protein
MVINNQTLRLLIRDAYSAGHVAEIRQLLETRGTLDFSSRPTGLFSASVVTSATEHTGYQNAWVRDNVYIAYAHYRNGQCNVAVRAVKALCEVFGKQRARFESVIENPKLATDPANRPYVRFDADSLENVKWYNAQNDAIGYFLWLYCLLANEHAIRIDGVEAVTLARVVRYLRAVRYWEDEDSGHWEEGRKVSASSIGAVVAGLRELNRLCENPRVATPLQPLISADSVDELTARGTDALQNILPWECRQPDEKKQRRFDSALLFLAYPLHVVGDQQAETIIGEVVDNLQGEYGIKRYLHDSFWCTDYRRNVPKLLRTADYSDNMEARDEFFVKGGEAQWSLFDPIISAYFGTRFQESGDASWLHRQTMYLNRSLGQITGKNGPYGEFKCPELYHQEDGRMETSETTPLLWTQANLWVALQEMEQSLRIVGEPSHSEKAPPLRS